MHTKAQKRVVTVMLAITFVLIFSSLPSVKPGTVNRNIQQQENIQ